MPINIRNILGQDEKLLKRKSWKSQQMFIRDMFFLKSELMFHQFLQEYIVVFFTDA